VRGQSGDALAAFVKGIERAERLANDLLDAYKAAANAALGNLEDG